MAKILGLDLGTNSIGWAIIESQKLENKISDAGVIVFQEGVNRVKGVESSKAAERTEYRRSRRIKFRRRLRKYQTLKVLIEHNMCPLTIDDLNKWVRYSKGQKRSYPSNKEFLSWIRTDELSAYNPYALRDQAATHTISKYELGRAFYHIAQRRGFLSNRKDLTKSSEGIVKTQIDEITKAKGDLTLGQYFNTLYQKGEKIRGHYTSRTHHYVQEFEKICQVQEIDEALHKQLYSAIFYQRPLRSQKQLVGNCIFETNKPRCPISHFIFEEFRMLSFINSIKYKKDGDSHFEFLSQDQRDLIIPKFMRISKASFQFSDISKALTPKGKDYIFNFKDKDTVKGCPVSARLADVFGDSWRETTIQHTGCDGKIKNYDINDIWHVLFDFDNNDLLKEFGKQRLHLDDTQLASFLKTPIQQGYASLSLKAIKKILPFLRKGEIYTHAVFLANIPFIVEHKTWNQSQQTIIKDIKKIINGYNDEKTDAAITNNILRYIHEEEKKYRSIEKEEILELIGANITDYLGSNHWDKIEESEKNRYIEKIWKNVEFVLNTRMRYYQIPRLDESIESFLRLHYDSISEKKNTIFHPSDISFFEKIPVEQKDKRYLGSPAIPAIKNPMAMRTMYQLRKLINHMLQEDMIDENTEIHIELANDLNDRNKREAIHRYQKEKEKQRSDYAKEIASFYSDHFNLNVIPTETEILKYQLWEEQHHMCLYTGEQIGLSQFLGDNPTYDLEHTIARSYSYDNSQENLTLCSAHYNRTEKKQFLPTELNNYSSILQRVDEAFMKPLSQIELIISKKKTGSINEDKEAKDKRIQEKEYFYLKKRYLFEKYRRFTMEDIPSGFKNSQLNDTRIITKYAAQYLKTSFDKVFPIKGSLTAEFRKLWGIQNRYEKKERISHLHHTIDAIVLCGITRDKYQQLATAIKDDSTKGLRDFPKPWESIASDIEDTIENILVVHHTPDRALQPTKRKLRNHGKVKYIDQEKKTKPIYVKGDSVRGQLHEDTRYGAIIVPPHDENRGNIRYVIRKPLSAINTEKDASNIVDAKIRSLVEKSIKNETFKEAQSNGLLFPTKDPDKTPTIIKSVRMYASAVNNPVLLKPNSSESKHAHKKMVYVVNKSNYLVALYEAIDSSGKIIKDFELVSLLSAIKNKEQPYPMFKLKKNITLPLKQVLRTGDIVLLKQSQDEDVWQSPRILGTRLFQITGLASSSNGCQIKLVQHTESRISKELKATNGKFVIESELQNPTVRMLYSSQIYALIKGIDFTISPTGVIKPIIQEESDA